MSLDPERLPYYSHPRGIKGVGRIIFYAGSMTVVILFLIPFTQYITSLVDGGPDIRTVDVVPPPPPPPPEFEEPPEAEEMEEPAPDLAPPPPMLSFSQLEVALEAGIGDAMGGGFGFGGFAVQPDIAAEIELFDVKDLDEVPRPRVQVKMEPPIRFKRERISGIVRLEIAIDEQGKTTVLNVVKTSHSELNESAIAAAEKWIWTPPKKNGKAVKARYVFPIGFAF
jgi:protein TonB